MDAFPRRSAGAATAIPITLTPVNTDTGRREIEPYQTAVVRRIFERYAASRSFSAVASELNEAGIAALMGGRWYPITVRRVLLNEVYIGRTVYRRTKRDRARLRVRTTL